LEKRVLIARPPGLEDSSRYWSVLMTLDHLRIVNLALVRIISSLAAGKVPEGRASTADVKPDPDVTAAVVREYDNSCDAVSEALAATRGLKTLACFTHPWFGPLDLSAWHALAGTHLAIHRVQIERILSGLR
jgi:DinB superfamily